MTDDDLKMLEEFKSRFRAGYSFSGHEITKLFAIIERLSETKEVVAYSYELATHRNTETGEYSNWRHHLSLLKPNAPEGSIRNLIALVAADTD